MTGAELLTIRAVNRRIAGAKRRLFFIDFDGTLVPIVRRPELVVFSDRSREALRALNCRPDTEVAIVSGRPLSFIRRVLRLRGMICAGNHGLEIAGPGVDFRHPEAVAARPALLKIKRAWQGLSGAFPGAIVEDKGMSVTFHYRQVRPSLQEDARQAAAAEALPAGGLRLTAGKKIVEARPAVRWGKGDALRFLFDRWGCRAGEDLPVVLGDDETDRDMFAVVGGEGLAVYVGRGSAPPEANARVGGPSTVTSLLEKAAHLPLR
jgi:trehalose-phosphatase